MRELFSSAETIGHPVWLPGGNTLLVPRYDDAYHRAQLWTVSLPGGEARRFTNDLSDYGADLDITRDGRTIVAINRTTVSNVWVAPAADSLIGRQITSGDPLMVDIAEAADGRFLSLSGQGELWIMNPDGSQRAPFTDLQHTGWLTPCGRFVVFASHEAGSIVLTRVNADGSHATTLVGGSLWGPTCATCTRRAPACSPDGRFVFYVNVEQPQKIWRIPIEGGAPVEIAEVLGDMVSGRLSVSPDGNLLAYAYEQYTVPPAGWNLTVIPIGGGAPITKFKVPGGIGGPRWSPDGEGLQYLLTQDGATNIWEQPLAGGEPKQLTKFTSGLIFDFNWSSDHTKLLLTRGGISSDVVLLNNPR